ELLHHLSHVRFPLFIAHKSLKLPAAMVLLKNVDCHSSHWDLVVLLHFELGLQVGLRLVSDRCRIAFPVVIAGLAVILAVLVMPLDKGVEGLAEKGIGRAHWVSGSADGPRLRLPVISKAP